MIVQLLAKSGNGLVALKFFNYWHQRAGLQDTLLKAWKVHIFGSPLFRVVMKLEAVKQTLKIWRKSDFFSPSMAAN